jgi:hypothetical protein
MQQNRTLIIRNQVTIHTDDPDEALQAGAIMLKVDPSALECTKMDSEHYQVSLKNVAGRFQIRVSDDEMTASLVILVPPKGEGKPVDAKSILKELLVQKVTYGILHDEIKAAVTRCRSEKVVVENVVVARGIPPVEGRDAQLEQLVDQRSIAAPGTEVARKLHCSEGQSGKNVRGVEVPPSKPSGRDLKIAYGKGIGRRTDGDLFISNEYGRVVFTSSGLAVEPLVRVADDKMTVSMTLYSRLAEGKEFTVDLLRSMLEAKGIRYGILEKNFIGELEQLRASDKSCKEIVVARGLQPDPGKDGKLQYRVNLSECIGFTRDDGSIDFHKRDYIKNVKAGQVLADIVPPEPGTEGINVYGEVIPATPGRDILVAPGDNVEVNRDTTQYIARIDGMIALKDYSLCVYDVYEIGGDVDYETGNVECNGNVVIRGSVKQTFTVNATGNVLIYKAVDNGTVICGGNLEVRGGIYNKDGGKVEAGGNIQAHFMVHARVKAGGNIAVKGEIFDSEAYADGYINATGRTGKIIGGSCHAAQGIEAREAGSPMYVKTRLRIGINIEDVEKLNTLEKQLAEVKKVLKKIATVTGKNPTREMITRIPQGKRKLFLRLLEKRNFFIHQYKELMTQKNQIEKRIRKNPDLSVKIHREIHPEVHIAILDKSLHVSERSSRSMFYYDSEKGCIALRAH